MYIKILSYRSIYFNSYMLKNYILQNNVICYIIVYIEKMREKV